MRYLGLSLGVSVVLGFCSAFGALIPPIFRDIAGVEGETFSGLMAETGGQLVVLGVLVCLVGIAICGRAGVMKERELSAAEKAATIKEFALVRGLSVAVISGILSACFNFGLEAGRPMAQMAEVAGANPLFRNNVVFVVVLWGGLTTNLLWCLVLAARNRSFGDYGKKDAPLPTNYLFSMLAGTTWFLQFFFYGMGESKMSNGAASWILHMAFIIALGNIWGLMLQEWRGVSRRTLTTLFVGIAVLLLSVVIVGYGNAL
jgi:L-rhamnose-H+ transport protein